MSPIVLLYITTASRQEAKTIGRRLVKERLVACVNLLDGMESIYLWDGEVRHESEVVMLAKTQSSCVSTVIERVEQLHSYDCPCIVALPVQDGNPDYLKWVEEQTRTPG